MKKVCFTLLFLLNLLFLSCQITPPLQCSVYVDCETGGTATVSRTKVPVGSFVTVTVSPSRGYRVSNLSVPHSFIQKVITESESVYKVKVTDEYFKITVSFRKKSSLDLYPHLTNCTYNTSDIPDEIYEGDIIKIKLNPDSHYYIPQENIQIQTNVYNNAEQIPFTVDSEDNNTISFCMPDSGVAIYADALPVVSISTDKESYKKGDSIPLKISRLGDVTSCNIYYSYSLADYKEILETNFDFTKQSISFASTEAGNISFYAELSDGTLFDLCNIDVNFDDLPSKKRVLSCHPYSVEKDYLSYNKLNVIYSFTSNKDLNYYSLESNGFFEEDNKPWYWNSVSSNIYDYEKKRIISKYVEYVYDEPAKAFIYFRTRDLQSDYIPVTVPCYEKVKFSDSSSISISKFEIYNKDDFSWEKGEGFDDLFEEPIYNSYYNSIRITSKEDAKPTKRPVSLILKDSDGKEKGRLAITLPYSGEPDIKIEQ